MLPFNTDKEFYINARVACEILLRDFYQYNPFIIVSCLYEIVILVLPGHFAVLNYATDTFIR